MRKVIITDTETGKRENENNVYINYAGTISFNDLLKIACRMRPDRIVIDLSRENLSPIAWKREFERGTA